MRGINNSKGEKDASRKPGEEKKLDEENQELEDKRPKCSKVVLGKRGKLPYLQILEASAQERKASTIL
jgi:hypothetical protein